MGAPSLNPTAPWQVLVEYPTSRVVARGPLMVVHFWGPMSPAELHAEFDAQEAELEKHGHLVQLVVFEASKLTRIGFDAQSVAAERLKRWGPRLLRSGLVVLGAGLGSRLIRAALQMATALSGQGATHRLFADLGGGLRWVSAAPGLVLPGQVSVEELTARFGIPPR